MAKNPTSNYITNQELLKEIRWYKETGKISERLGEMIIKIANGFGSKSKFYGEIEDMKGDAIEIIIRYLHNFDPNKSENPFAYLSQICYNAFGTYINKQKRRNGINEKINNHYELHKIKNVIDKAINYEEFLN